MSSRDLPGLANASSEDIIAAKKRLRTQARAARAALGESERAIASAEICVRLRRLFEEKPDRAVSVYLATPDEANIDDFIAWLLARSTQVFAPRAGGFAPLKSLDTVTLGQYGVREPEAGPHPTCPEGARLSPNGRERGDLIRKALPKEMAFQKNDDPSHPSPAKRIGRGAGGEGALILVPGLLFDARGGRLGFGGGWYDRALAHFPQALKIGVAFEQQIIAAVPREAHDVMMNLVITQKTEYRS